MLSLGMLPHELVSLSDEFLLGHLRQVAKRGAGIGRIQDLKSAANRSVGIKQGAGLAKMELQLLLTQYQLIQSKFDELHLKLDELIEQIPGVNRLLAIKGIGRDTIAGFIAEVGDIGNYHHPKQIHKACRIEFKGEHIR